MHKTPATIIPGSKNSSLAGRFCLGLIAAYGIAGCGGRGTVAGDEQTEQTNDFLFWSPSPALVTEHVNWHTAPTQAIPCGTQGRRKCTNQGEDFFLFHRNFLRRLRDEYIAQGLPANIDTWVSLPPEM